MLKLAVCDDDVAQVDRITDIINKRFGVNNDDAFNVKYFTNPDDLIKLNDKLAEIYVSRQKS